MKKMFKISTIVLFMSSLNAHADLQCREVELGQIGRDFWEDSLSNGLKGELVSQIQRKDDLSASLLPEIEFTLSPRVDFNLRFTRSIKNNLPLPKTGRISQSDLFSLKVQNKLNFEFVGKKNGPYFFSDANAGVSLVHSTSKYPGFEEDSCKLYAKILDQKTKAGQDVLNAACKDRDKLAIFKYYDATIDFFSKKFIGNAFLKIFDSEKNREYFQDPLASLKLHSLLGFPIDSEIFRTENNSIAIGDIVEHTSFYGVRPLGIKLELVNFVTPTYSHYKKFFRTLSYKKLIGNKVLVEVEDTLLSGNEIEIYKIDPKILGIIKLNFGEWSNDNFKQESLLQRFEIDLNDREGSGQEFFDKILLSAYLPEFSLNKDSVLIDHSGYESNVKADKAVYKNSEGADDRLVLRIPKIISYERRSYPKTDKIHHDNKKFESSEKLLRRKIEKPWALWRSPKIDKSFECKLKVFSTSLIALQNDSSMNIECSYYNKYAQNSEAKEVAEYLDMLTLTKLSDLDRKTLESLTYEQQDKINLYSNLSFSRKEIENIVNASPEKVYNSLSKLIFGSNAENVFAPKFHDKWKEARPFTARPISNKEKRLRKSKEYRQCSNLLEILKITNGHDELYSKLNGIAGNKKGIDSYSLNRCYSYFTMAKSIAQSIFDFQESVSKSGSLVKVLDVFEDLNKVGLYQALLASLAGGVEQDRVRFTYIVTSPYLENVVADTNGKKYDIESIKLKRNLRTELNSEFFSRVKDLRFTYKTCDPSVIISYLRLNYPLQDREKTYAKFRMSYYSNRPEENITEQVHSFDKMILFPSGEYVSLIKLDKPIEENRSHNMFFEIINKKEMRLSREVKVFLKKTYDHTSQDRD